jgi:hypothetical protein
MIRLLGFTVTALIATALMAACDQSDVPLAPTPEAGGPSFRMFTEHFTIHEPFELEEFSDCTDEPVTLVGFVHHSLNVTSTDFSFGELHTSDHFTFHATSTGAITGIVYLFQDEAQFSFNSPSGPAPNFTQTEHREAHIISKGSPDNTFLRFDLHILVTGQGEFKTAVDNFTFVCTG